MAPAVALRRTVALGVIGVSAGDYARRLRSPARATWRPAGGRNVTTSALAARVLGERGSPVVLLHGLVASGLWWGAAYDALARRHRLVVPDLLGFGRSPRPTAGCGPDDHVAALLSCLDELGITEPITIGAHSLGSLLAIRLAATHPDRVAGIVAFGPPLYADRRAALAHLGAAGPMGRLFVLPGAAAQVACRVICRHRGVAARIGVVTHPSLPPPIAADSVQHTWASYSQTLERVILEAEGRDWLTELRSPVRLIAGDGDRVVDRDFLGHLPGEVDGLSVDVWKGAHDLPLVRPRECVEAIAQMADTAVDGGSGDAELPVSWA